jgi:N6-adenosine-specific RNA methylase IME4
MLSISLQFFHDDPHASEGRSGPTRFPRSFSLRRKREHSRNPDHVRERIERLLGGPYIELFARETRYGWDCWGVISPPFDNGAAETRRQPSCLTAKGSSLMLVD